MIVIYEVWWNRVLDLDVIMVAQDTWLIVSNIRTYHFIRHNKMWWRQTRNRLSDQTYLTVTQFSFWWYRIIKDALLQSLIGDPFFNLINVCKLCLRTAGLVTLSIKNDNNISQTIYIGSRVATPFSNKWTKQGSITLKIIHIIAF